MKLNYSNDGRMYVLGIPKFSSCVTNISINYNNTNKSKQQNKIKLHCIKLISFNIGKYK